MKNFDLSNQFCVRQFDAQVAKFKESEDYVTLERVPAPRSGNQNRYLHALLGLLAVYTGYTLDEIKDVAKRKFSPRYESNGTTFIKKTRNFSKEEMTVFIDKLRHWGNEEVGCIMPTSEEWAMNWREIDNQIKGYRNR